MEYLISIFSYVRMDMGSPLCVAHLKISPRMQLYLVWQVIKSPLIFFPYAPGCDSAVICPLKSHNGVR